MFEIKDRAAFAKNAAKAGWLAPLILGGVNALLGQNKEFSGLYVFLLTSLVLCTIGFVSSLLALGLVREVGRKGVLLPGIVGLLLNCFLLALMAYGFYSGLTRADREIVRLHSEAQTLLAQGRYAEADKAASDACARAEKRYAESNPIVAECLNTLGTVRHAEDRFSEAVPLFERAIALEERKAKPDEVTLGVRYCNLCRAWLRLGRLDDAEKAGKKSLASLEARGGEENPDLPPTLDALGELARRRDRYAEAEVYFKKALAIREKAPAPDRLDVAISLGQLGNLFVEQGDYSQAEAFYKKSLAIREKALERDHPDIARTLDSLGVAYYQSERYDLAEPCFSRAVAIREKRLPPGHPDLDASLNNLAYCLKAEGKTDESAKVFERCIEVRSRRLGPDHPDVASLKESLASLRK
jgi:tetratricopeptide (TPR) repeat protein